MTERLAQTGSAARLRLVAARQRIMEEFERFRDHVDDADEPTLEATELPEESVQGTLEEIDAALGRLDGGCYGTCLECGEPIDELRLEALPQAARCVRCQVRTENGIT